MTPLKIAIDRIEDMLKGDDGQAWKEAEKALPGLKKALELESRSVHLAQLSWGGFNLHGDEKSIREAQRLLHEAAKVPALYERIDELQKIPELNPEDIVVNVVYKQLGGFAPIVSHGVRVAHKPSRISVVVDSERSQHKNRQLALQALRSIISEEFKS